MIALLLAFAAWPPSRTDAAAVLCKSALARQVAGEIATMQIDGSHNSHGRLTIEGRLTVYSQMGPAPPGTARTHHVGRFDLNYRCEVSRGRVRKVRTNPANP